MWMLRKQKLLPITERAGKVRKEWNLIENSSILCWYLKGYIKRYGNIRDRNEQDDEFKCRTFKIQEKTQQNGAEA